ncbi:hypothetical protein PENCOP_c011G00079 [Penicillium coprophilum]|uniref:Uncharacterized protein n=1 Tax=Penicillium coprophilum TaxID=36646 RepID=A0A1V6UEK3_9EURO|nr:hypothetical protein PENCOP_c011G00079 [Penicillium coprophilum]
MRYHLLFAALGALISLILAQKAPDCNAFQKTCASNKGNTEGHITYDLTQALPLSDWTTIGGEVVAGSDESKSTVLRSNSTSAASSMITPSSTLNSSTGAIASASSFNSASAHDSGYSALLATIVGFIQLWG